MNAKTQAVKVLNRSGSAILTAHIHSWEWDAQLQALRLTVEGTSGEIGQKVYQLANLMGARIASISEGDGVYTITFQDFT